MESLSFLVGTGSPSPDELFPKVLPWAVALLALAIVGAVVIYLARRLMNTDSSTSDPGFTLQSLRDLRDQGEITDEEYERARQLMIGKVKGTSAAKSAKSDHVESPERSDNYSS